MVVPWADDRGNGEEAKVPQKDDVEAAETRICDAMKQEAMEGGRHRMGD